MLHLPVAKAERPAASGGAQTERLSISGRKLARKQPNRNLPSFFFPKASLCGSMRHNIFDKIMPGAYGF